MLENIMKTSIARDYDVVASHHHEDERGGDVLLFIS